MFVLSIFSFIGVVLLRHTGAPYKSTEKEVMAAIKTGQKHQKSQKNHEPYELCQRGATSFFNVATATTLLRTICLLPFHYEFHIMCSKFLVQRPIQFYKITFDENKSSQTFSQRNLILKIVLPYIRIRCMSSKLTVSARCIFQKIQNQKSQCIDFNRHQN